jgi:hypothetical protein
MVKRTLFSIEAIAMKAKRNLFLRAARHAFSGVVCAGAVLLFAASAQSQNLFVTDFWSGNVYEFTPGGVRTTFASGFTGPSGLAFNNAGNLFIGNEINGNLSGTNIIYGNSVTEITPDGTQSTFAFPVDEPRGLAFDSAGDLFVANAVPNSVYEIKPDGTQSTFASGGLSYQRRNPSRRYHAVSVLFNHRPGFNGRGELDQRLYQHPALHFYRLNGDDVAVSLLSRPACSMNTVCNSGLTFQSF